ncbi:hypothetical protein OV208_11160 [Corallococcus sp. bb12-1]|uniref:hypothetical protein n=1 Tax=Corallococcus sp. bb12-1 TaxID=2996784 RepID=UPI00226EB8C1|nr:hypothetical protein [Corallococcus sp. bb12-1]MCY1041872.1 hypothetical protein [Corallococcus sp. bb12-1]
MKNQVLLLGLLLLVACKGAIGGDASPDASVPDAGGPPPEPSASACEVEAMVVARCGGCHGAVPTEGAPMPLNSLDAMRAPSMKDPAVSNAQRSLIRMADTAAPMPPAPGSPATQLEVAVLAGWMADGMPSCTTSPDGGTPTVASPNLIPQAELFACSAGVASDAPTRLRRLNRWQFTRNVSGSVTRSWTGFTFFDNPFDAEAHEQYSSWASTATVDDTTLDLFLPVVADAPLPYPFTGNNRMEWMNENGSAQRCMFHEDHPSAACVKGYVSAFLEHGVFYRPPLEREVNRLTAFAVEVLAQEPAPNPTNRTATLARISTAAWVMPGALFRDEFGTEENGRAVLGPWELAQQLAYAVGNRAPGATPTWIYTPQPYSEDPVKGYMGGIAEAARDGSIRDDARVDALLRQYAGGVDPTRFDLVQDHRDADRRKRRGEYWLADGLSGFFREWLGYEHLALGFKDDPAKTSRFDDEGQKASDSSYSYFNLMTGYYGPESTLVQQLDDVVAKVVLADK